MIKTKLKKKKHLKLDYMVKIDKKKNIHIIYYIIKKKK